MIVKAGGEKPPNTVRLRIFVGWVEALRNPTNRIKSWVELSFVPQPNLHIFIF
jgi:hypothetical protein